MRLSSPRPLWSRSRRLICFAMAAGLLMLSAGGTVAEAPTQIDTSLITDSEIPNPSSVVQLLLKSNQKLVTVFDTSALSESSIITDAEKPTPKSVTLEILEIQRRLGGSIVSDREMLRNLPTFRCVDQAEVTDYPAAVAQLSSTFSGIQRTEKMADSAVGTVDMLRDAAWQLLQSAEKLERSELYKQADALRSLAQQFRLDARTLSVGSDK